MYIYCILTIKLLKFFHENKNESFYFTSKNFNWCLEFNEFLYCKKNQKIKYSINFNFKKKLYYSKLFVREDKTI